WAAYSAAQWQPLEAVLFALKAIAEAVPAHEAKSLPRLFGPPLLDSLEACLLQAERPPADDAAVHAHRLRRTAVELVASYSDWLRARPGLAARMMQMLLLALLRLPTTETAVRAAAARAFRDLAEPPARSCPDEEVHAWTEASAARQTVLTTVAPLSS